MSELLSLLRDHTCPLTGQPCQAGSYAECKRFWECIRQAQQRMQEADEPQTDGDRNT